MLFASLIQTAAGMPGHQPVSSSVELLATVVMLQEVMFTFVPSILIPPADELE